jgi:hypothetical protein
VAINGGGYVESIAEHALAMARLILEHENLKLGQFNQFMRNRILSGGLCESSALTASEPPPPG